MQQLHGNGMKMYERLVEDILRQVIETSRLPAEGKSSVCLICMKYRIISLIIIIISMGQILLSYIANTSRTYARTHARTHGRPGARTHTRAHAPARTRAHTHTSHTHTPASPYRYWMGLCQQTVTTRSAGDNSWSLAIENKH